MNSHSRKKKQLPSPSNSNNSSSKSNVYEDSSSQSEESQKERVTKKKVWTAAELAVQMKPTQDEIRYRKKKIKSEDQEKVSRYFKCTKCQLNFKPLNKNINKIAIHSYLKVLFCKMCLEFYDDGEFSVDSDGEEKYCRWCGEGGLIYSCSECVCGFCTICIKKHFGVKYNGQVKRKNNWKCFFCFPKPLWFLRYVCSVAAEETNYKISGLSPCLTSQCESVDSFDSGDSSKSQDCNKAELKSGSHEKEAKEVFDEGCSTDSISLILYETKKLSETVVLDTPVSKKGTKRKRILYSSSDDSDEIISAKSLKKVKTRESLESHSIKPNVVRPDVLERLEKILRLAEYQMGFGVSWSSKMLTKLYKSNSLSSSEEIKSECQKIKWFFSILSTHLVESCSSVDLIEKSIESNEQRMATSPDKSKQGDYSTVVKFLDFVTNQVKVFLEKGICLQDLLEGEIYHDSQIIGIKVKSNAPASSSKGTPTTTPRNKMKMDESKVLESKLYNSERTSDEESIVPMLEQERDYSETDDCRRLILSDPSQDCSEEVEDHKSKIQEIMSILENA